MTQDNDKEFRHMLDNVEEIPLKMLENWHRGDDNRIEMVAKALADGDVSFYMKTDLSDDGTKHYKNNLWNIATGKIDVPNHVPLTGYQRVVKIKEYMSVGLYWPYHFMINAASLKKWIEKTFQPVLDSKPDFMSKELSIALECNRSLYSENPGTKAGNEGKDIRDWLEDKHPELSGAAVTRISQVVNPGVKPSGK